MNKYDRIRAQLEGGRVKRCHTADYIGHYDNAQHSFNMCILYLALHPEPKFRVVKAILYHDLAERFTGDLPAPALIEFPELREGIKKVEAHCRKVMGVEIDIEEEEAHWVHTIDKVEHYLWAVRQVSMGNTRVEHHLRKLELILAQLRGEGKVPVEIEDFLTHYDHRHGDDGLPT